MVFKQKIKKIHICAAEANHGYTSAVFLFILM